MSVDAAAIIVAITTAAGALVQGTDLPQPVKEQAAGAIAVVEQSSPDVGKQVDDALSVLPEPVREQAEQIVTQTSDLVEQALDPYLPSVDVPPSPEIHSESVPAPLAQPIPPAESAPRQGRPPVLEAERDQPSTAVDSGFAEVPGEVAAAPGVPGIVGGLGSVVPSVPAGFPGVSLAPVGAVAVFAPWIRKAGSLCAGITPPTLAALYSVENGFRYGETAPVSRAGARGPGQFMPDTWARYGKDADGDGKVDINGVADPMMASGRMLCDLYSQIEEWKQEGVVHGDILDLAIAAYNAGAGAVRLAGGMPAGKFDYEHETQPYVARIRSLEDSFARMLSPFFYGLGAINGNSRVIDMAMRYIGLPYVWGGGTVDGPSGGGFDCSGLTLFAVYAATGIVLPRTSETQWAVGTEVPLTEVRPGDLLFGNWGPNGPGHVAIYVGNGQMLHAPTTGDVVRIGPVFSGMKARRIL